MKLFKFPDCIDVHVSETFLPGRSEARASLMLHAVAISSDDATPDGVMRLAEESAESVLKGAGLRAAYYFDADILPFLELGQEFKRGDLLGIVTIIVRTPGEEYVGIHWAGSDPHAFAPTDPDDIADDLRAGVMVLA